MEEKPQKFGTQLRPPVKRHLDELVAELGNEAGMKQQVVEAALLMFFDANLAAQQQWIKKVRMASLEGGTSGIVKSIKAKRSRRPHIAKE